MAAMSVGSDPDGGLTAPVEWDRTIADQLATVIPMRQFASSQSVKGRGFKRLYNLHGASSGWVGETDASVARSIYQETLCLVLYKKARRWWFVEP